MVFRALVRTHTATFANALALGAPMPSSSPKSPDTPVVVDHNADLWHGVRNGELVSKDFSESGHLRLSATVHGHPALLRVGTAANGGSDRFLNKTTQYLPRPPVPPPPPPPPQPTYDPRIDILKRELVLAEVHIARLQRKLEAARSDNNMLNDLVETFAALFAKRRKPPDGRM